MIREINLGSTESVLEEPFTKGLGRFRFYHPAGTFAITPASNILFRAIIDHADLLHGVGFDWGSGIGCQAILAARIPAVQLVYGLEISEAKRADFKAERSGKRIGAEGSLPLLRFLLPV